MRPRSFPSLLAALLSAGCAGWLAGAVIGVAPAVAHGAPVAAVANVDAGAAVADADTSALADARRGGDVADQPSRGTPQAPAPVDATPPGTPAAVEAAPGPVAVVTILGFPAASGAAATSRQAPPPTQTAPPQPPTHAPTPRPAPPPPPPPPPPPTSAAPPSDTQPPSSTPYTRQQIIDMIRSAAAAHGVNGDCMVSLAQRESGLNPDAYNPSGPYDGLFQFWPPTYRAHGGTDVWNPRQQSDVAASMMAEGDGPGAWGIAC